jgi:glycosyltransferase involved in cell wall biosynthesis
MACGAPVVAMRNTAIAEVVGDGGVLVEESGGAAPFELARITRGPGREAIERLASEAARIAADTSHRNGLVAAAHRQACRYSTERFITGLRGAYEFAV